MHISTQLHLVHEIDRLRKVINAAAEKTLMLSAAQEAHDLAMPVPIDPSFSYKIEGKEKTLNMLSNEIRLYTKSADEVEVIQFQLASTLLMLALQFIEGSLDSMQLTLGGARVKKVA